METYILSNPEDISENIKSAQINVFEGTVFSSLLVTFEYKGQPRTTEHGVAKGLRGCKNIFTRDWGKGAKWILEDFNDVK